MGFNQPETLPLPASTSVPVTLFRQAAYPVWADTTRPYCCAVDYHFNAVPSVVGGGTGVSGEVSVNVGPSLDWWTTADRSVGAEFPGIAGTPVGNFPYPILGRDDAEPGPEFIYCPPGSQAGVIVYIKSGTVSTAITNVGATLEIWQAPGSTASFTLTGQILAGQKGGFMAFAPSVAQSWFRISSMNFTNSNTGAIDFRDSGATIYVSSAPTNTYTSSATTNGVLTFGTVASVQRHLPLVYPKEFSNSTLPWRAARVTASAFLGTNVSQVLNKGGTVLGGRMSPAVINAWALTEQDVAALHPAEKAFLPLETGVYTYAPPSTDLVFFHDYTSTNTPGTGTAQVPVFRLDNDSLYNKMFITAAGATESLACTVSYHIEFRTSSSLFQIGLSGMTLESLHTAQLSLAEAGFFFENPEHDSVLKKVIASAKKFAPQVVGAINPAAGKLLTSIIGKNTVRPKSGPSRAPGTSGKASGIVADKPQPKAKPAAKAQRGRSKSVKR